MLIDICPQDYQDFVHYEGNQKVLYVEMKNALYGVLQSLLLYYNKFQKDLKKMDSTSIYTIPVLQTDL